MSSSTMESPTALGDIRVLELASWLAGPFAGCLLADFGAEVIKVEQPGKGDEGRKLGLPDPSDDTRTPGWVTFSRNKKSVSLDLRRDEARKIVFDLVAKSDVLIESFRPGTLEKWGMGWEELSEVNPGLVMLRISGFGQQGPLRNKPGFDRVAQAFSGLMYMTGEPDSGPSRCGVSVVDFGSGLWGAFGVMTALHARSVNGGRGQFIDHALYDTILPFLFDVPFDWVRHGRIREREGSRHPTIAPGGAYASGEGHWFMVTATSRGAFEGLMNSLGLDEIVQDERYGSAAFRLENRPLLDSLIQGRMSELSDTELTELFDKFQVPYSPVLNIQQLWEHPHVQERGDFVTIDDPVIGPIPTAKPRPQLSLTPGSIRTTGPGVGEHNAEIYGGLLGYSVEDLQRLRDAGVV
jgi:crotonobetainyl-CoA:carnitine CoA-transferase CaiB-like acyl-CoA transferase